MSGTARDEEEAMRDTMFVVSTLVFFVVAVLYVTFCEALRQ